MTTIHVFRKLVKNSYNILVNISSGPSFISKPKACCWPVVFHFHVRQNLSLSQYCNTEYSSKLSKSSTLCRTGAQVDGLYSPQALQNDRWGYGHRLLKRMFSTTPGLTSSQLIYQGPLTTMVKAVKFLSLGTTIMSACIIPMVLMYGESGVMATIGLSFASVMLATPIVLHWFSRSYVTELYFDEETDAYTAKTVTFILREATHTFKAEDVLVPPVRNVFTSFVAKGRPFLVDPKAFSDMHQLSNLMGHAQSLTQEDIDEMKKKMNDDED